MNNDNYCEYLNNCLSDMKNEMNHDHNNVIDFRNNMKRFINCKIKKYPIIENILNKSNKSNKLNLEHSEYLISGGARTKDDKTTPKENEFSKKLLKIFELTKQYEKIQAIPDFDKRVKIMTEELDKIHEAINKIKDKDIGETSRILEGDRIQNSFDIMATNIKNMEHGFEIIPKKVEMYLPFNYRDMNEYIYVDNNTKSLFYDIFDELKKRFDSIKQQHGKVGLNIDTELNKLSVVISNRNEQINKKTEQITSVLKSINTTIETLKNSYENLEFSEMDIQKVINISELNDIISKINHSNDKNLEFFVMKMKSQYENLMTKKIKERTYIDTYNDEVQTLEYSLKEQYKLPDPYFDGTYTTRISNNLLVSMDVTKDKLDILTRLLNVNNTNDISYEESITNINDIYQPDFGSMIKKQTQDNSGSQIGQTQLPEPPYMAGGAENLEIIEKELNKYYEIGIIYGNLQSEYRAKVVLYNTYQMYVTIHNAFLILIATNQIFTSGYVVYNYINKGTIEFFRRILDNIVKKIDSINSSQTSSMNEDVLYMRKYHYITIKKLYNFMNWISGKLGAKDVVDIRRCTGKVYDCFILFNYFKTVLESYNEMFQNKITIYARINDIGYNYEKDYDTTGSNAKDTFTKQVFISDYEHKILDKKDTNPVNTATMWIESNKNTCPPLFSKDNKNKEMNYKFTEVFDSVNFPSNGDISKYMTMDTQIAKGKGVAVMTYGYSGTGKTFTLFGSRDIGKEGVLQATLNGINGLKKIHFRLYEIFGYGMAYPHYWSAPDGSSRMNDIDNRIYHYSPAYDTSGNLKFDNVIRYNAKEIANYTSDNLPDKGTKGSTYFEITKDLTLNVLRNFDAFIGQVENYREGKDPRKEIFEKKDFVPRVEKTPNNRVSSRSVILYDFQIYLEDMDNPVPFIIVDLPGREEIIETYINPYINSPVIRHILNLGRDNNLNSQYYVIQFLLSVMALNPIAVPIFYANVKDNIYKFIDNKYKYILNDRLPFRFPLNKEIETEKIHGYENKTYLDMIREKYVVEKGEDDKYYVVNPVGQNGFTFDEELINRVGTTVYDLIGGIKSKGFRGFGYLPARQNESQYYSLLSIHAMNRLIMLNKFDIIKEIYQKICKEFINDSIDKYVDNMKDVTEIRDITNNLLSTQFKGERVIRSEVSEFRRIVESVIEKNPNIIISDTDMPIIKAELKSILGYDYYLTPFTGIYINENIIGLIKYLAGKMIKEEVDRDKFLNEQIHKQDDKLDFSFQQKVSRVWLMSNPTVTPKEIQEFYDFENIADVPLKLKLKDENSDNLKFNIDNMVDEYEKVRTSYHSNYIFNFKQPLITEILDPYITKINDYKVFYLFGNYKDEVTRDLKCEHQVNLLNSTGDFINIITGK
ncbi:MAG: hypothetical protein Terrestrivirus2_230 [Terrestrivirus sp.]|uniref:Kinesin motor domain-containing protein n=1 Tax=Terrestrivirus sp. TaxID=2487775 RepID=A0A3G4ZLJ8_9VIRU|nr:MAG: hypothetical protein Terrestrivirus2_230 [Terrestrivirus sp.]